MGCTAGRVARVPMPPQYVPVQPLWSAGAPPPSTLVYPRLYLGRAPKPSEFMAARRTFLAELRTAMAVTGMSFGYLKLSAAPATERHVIGGIGLGIAFLWIAFAAWMYSRRIDAFVMEQTDKRHYKIFLDRWTGRVSAALLLGLLAVAAIWRLAAGEEG